MREEEFSEVAEPWQALTMSGRRRREQQMCGTGGSEGEDDLLVSLASSGTNETTETRIPISLACFSPHLSFVSLLPSRHGNSPSCILGDEFKSNLGLTMVYREESF